MERKKIISVKCIFNKQNILFICLNQVSLLLSVFFGYSFFPLFKKGNYLLGVIFIVCLLLSLGLMCFTTLVLMRKYDDKTNKSDFDAGRFVYLFISLSFTGVIFTIFALIMNKFYSKNAFFIPGTAGILFVLAILCLFAGLLYINYLFTRKNENNPN